MAIDNQAEREVVPVTTPQESFHLRRVVVVDNKDYREKTHLCATQGLSR